MKKPSKASSKSKKKENNSFLLNEDLWKSLAENSPDHIMLMDLDATILYINRTVPGLKGEDVIGTSMYDYVPKESHKVVSEYLQQVLETGKPIHYLISYKALENEVLHFDVRIAPVIKDGKITSFISSSTDITQKQNDEVALRESEERHNQLLGNIDAIVWRFDLKNDKWLFVSPQAEKILGYLPHEWLNFQWWVDIMHVDDQGWAPEFCISQTKLNKSHDFEYRLHHENGNIVWIHDKVEVEIIDNEPAYLFGVMFDITKQKNNELALRKSETLFRLLANNSKDLIYRYELLPIPYFSFVSSSAFEITGYTADEHYADPQLGYKLVHPDDVAILEAVASGKTDAKQPIVLRWIRKDGTIIWTEQQNSFVYDANGNAIAIEGIARDITERKQAERILEIRAELLKFSIHCTLDQLIQKTLDEVEILTESKIGFFHFVEEDQETLILQHWSTNTLQKMCTAEGKGSHYSIDKAGVWVDCVYARKTIIHNDYNNLPHRKGLPEGHAPIIRELVVPIFRNEKIVGIIGFGNKVTDYDQADAQNVEDIADLIWDIVDRKRTEIRLLESENKYRSLVETAQELVWKCDSEGRFMYLNKAWEITHGYRLDEMLGKSFADFQAPEIVERDKIGFVREYGGGAIKEYETQLISKDGKEITLLLNIIPLFDFEGKVVGTQGTAIDITARKQAEKALSKSQLLLKSSIESQKDTILLSIDHNFQYLYFNKAHWEAMKSVYNKDVKLGMNILECITSDEDRKVARQNYERALKGESHSNTRVYGDIKLAYYESFFNPVVNTNNDIIGATAMARNITERKRIEDALKESEENYHKIFTEMIDGSSINEIIYDSSGKAVDYITLDVNPAFEKMLDVPREAVVGMSASNFMSKKELNHWLEIFAPVVQNGHSAKYNMYSPVNQKFFEGNAYLHRKRMFAVTFSDVTERMKAEELLKESEMKYRSLVETAQELVWKCDENGCFTYLNPAWEKTHGYSIEEMLGKSFSEFQTPEVFARDTIEFTRHLAGGSLKEYETTHIAKNGKELTLLFNAIPLFDLNGNVIGIQGTAIDITQRKNAENKLLEANKQLHELSEHLQTIREEERETIAREIHEDIGQQIAFIKISAERLNKKLVKDPKSTKEFSEMLVSIDEALKSIRKISTSLRPDMIENLGLYSTLLWKANNFFNGTGINCSLEIIGDEPVFSSGTAAINIFRIFQETLINTQKHAGATEIKAQIKCENKNFVFTIKDNGKGFDLEKNQTTASFGLLEMKERTIGINGTIEINSEAGKGTTIELKVPIKG